MIERIALRKTIQTALGRSRVVVLVGPRQCGKTTMARSFVPPDSPNYFDLEDPVSLARLEEPLTALRALRGLVAIDEIQRRKDLFPILRVLADRDPLTAQFLILGSASPDLLNQSSESLAGRVEIVSMGAFGLAEVGTGSLPRLWLRGGFPRSFLAQSEEDSLVWRKNLIQSFVERDLPQLGVRAPALTMLRFWSMVAHYHGQTWNAAEPARSLGVSEPTVRRYLDLLDGIFMVRQLQPWHANLLKRQVKSPKVYFRDSGLLHSLLGIRSDGDLQRHPKSGASWEGFALEEALRALNPDEAYFWATHGGAELDLLALKNGLKLGVEFKRVDAPVLTPSMRTTMADLGLDHLAVVYPGERRYSLADQVTVVPLVDMVSTGAATLLPN